MTNGTSSKAKRYEYENVKIGDTNFLGIYEVCNSDIPLALCYDSIFADHITDVLNDYHANKMLFDDTEVYLERSLESLFKRGTLDAF